MPGGVVLFWRSGMCCDMSSRSINVFHLGLARGELPSPLG